MVFNCTGTITRWIFRAEETVNNNDIFPEISTWRELSFTQSITDFVRISRSGSAEELTGNGPLYEYVLQEPVEVQEGDILGIELRPRDNEIKFEFLDLGDGNAPESYHRTNSRRLINTAQSVASNRQYVLLITAVIGEYVKAHTSRESRLCL